MTALHPMTGKNPSARDSSFETAISRDSSLAEVLTDQLITALSALIDLRKANPAPLYYQLAQGVERLIDGGTLSSGDQLPPMAKIASSLRINTGTVRSAWAYLEKQGTITREAHTGVFVK